LSIRTAVQHGSSSHSPVVGGSSSSLPNFAGLMSSYGSCADGAGSPLSAAAAAAAHTGLLTEGSSGWAAVAGGSAAAGGSSRFAAPSSLGLVPPPPPPPPTDRQGMPGRCRRLVLMFQHLAAVSVVCVCTSSESVVGVLCQRFLLALLLSLRQLNLPFLRLLCHQNQQAHLQAAC
jgi:hypothetical protein